MRTQNKHYVVITENGVERLYPLKEWFRANLNMPDDKRMTSHGMRNHLKRKGWRIKETEDQVLIIKPSTETIADFASENDGSVESEDQSNVSAESSLFALESHLRDYLSKNLNSAIKFDTPLSVVDVEYSTAVGPIDLLAKNDAGDYYVFELKLERGADAALGQLLRYKGWCEKHLSQGRKVYGIILAAEISDKLRYAASCVPDVTLLEYELQIQVRPVQKI